MSTDQQNLDADAAPSGGGLAVTDIYYVLFRRKWLLVLGLLLGVLVAAAMWKLRQPPYLSEAKLFVKYVIDTSANVPQGSASQINKVEDNGASVIGSEIEILTSQDIATHVAAVIGPERIVSRGESSDITNDAAAYILKKLNVLHLQRTKVIHLEFQHKDPTVPQRVLRELIDAYLKKHEGVHTARVSDETLNQQDEQLRVAITNCEVRLKFLKDKAGVSSLEEAKREGIKLASSIKQGLFTARAELAHQRATRDAMQAQGVRLTNAASGANSEVPPGKLEEYKAVLTQLDVLNRRRAEYSGLSDSVPQVATNLLQLRAASARKASLEALHPALPRLMLPAAALPASQPTANPATLVYELQALESKAGELSNQLSSVEFQLTKIEEVETEVADLERRRASLQKQLEQNEFGRQQFNFKSTLDASQNAPISRVQEPTPPTRDFAQLFKKMGMAVAGGLGFGIALAFLLEMFLDRTLKRPKDVEAALAVPLFLTIPYTRFRGLLADSDSRSSRKALSAPAGSPDKGASSAVVLTDLVKPPEPNQELKPYNDALRDRLMNYFDVRDMTHKPKLIAVTSCRDGAGVSTVASGLAASLSETGDGNVLLVDMRGQQGAAHAFYHGKPAMGLAEALEDETRGGAQVNENLYVVSAGSLDKKLEKVFPKQFSQFVPKLKASDYDYIIFDMPPVGQTSVTAKVARFMDMVLMVVESENTDKDAARKAGALLADANATVATVLNKQRSYVPGWLHQELQ